MITEDQIIEIIERHLDLDTVHIHWHQEAINPIRDMAVEIMELVETEIDIQVDIAVHQTIAGEDM